MPDLKPKPEERFRDQWRFREKVYARIRLRHNVPHAPPLFEQLREGLRKQILEQRLLPGDVLIPRRHLCQRLGVNRVIVNQAIRDLITEGVLRSEHGRGVFVNDRTPKTVGLVAPMSRRDLLKKPRASYRLIAAAAREALTKAHVRIAYLTREERGPGLRFGPRLSEVLQADVDAYLPLGIQNEEYLRALVRSGRPVVALDAAPTTDQFDGVVFDTFRAGYLAVRHLLEQGHRRIFYLGWDRGRHPEDPRGRVRIPEPDYERMLAGYGYALKQAGVPKRPEWVCEFLPEPGSRGEARLKRKLTSGAVTGALLCRHALKWLSGFVRVPQDLSVVVPMMPGGLAGKKNRWSCCVFREGALGREAARRMLERLEQQDSGKAAARREEPSMVTVPPILVPGETVRSVGPPPPLFQYHARDHAAGIARVKLTAGRNTCAFSLTTKSNNG